MKGFFKKATAVFSTDKNPEEKKSSGDSFQSSKNTSLLAPKAPPQKPVVEESFNNQILLNAKIGLSAGKPTPEPAKNTDPKKEDEKKVAAPGSDTLEPEYAQIMEIEINEKYNQKKD